MQASSSSASDAVIELKRLLTSPPLHIVQGRQFSNPIAVTHAVLEALRETGDDSCLFQRSTIEIVYRGIQPHDATLVIKEPDEEFFFHCVSGFRQVVLWNWNTYNLQFRNSVRDYWMVLGHLLGNHLCTTCKSSPSSLSNALRLACYAASAAMWKRGWDNEDNGMPTSENGGTNLNAKEEILLRGMATSLRSYPTVSVTGKTGLLQYLETLYQTYPELSATFTTVLIGEFSSKSSVVYRLPLEFHRESHRNFEKTYLTSLLKMSMTSLNRAFLNIDRVNPSQERIWEASSIMQLIVDILSWEFGSAAFDIGSVGASSVNQTVIRPPSHWKDILLQPELCRALFHLNQLVRFHTQHLPLVKQSIKLVNSIHQLLLQLASLSGPILSNPLEKTFLASHLADGALQHLDQLLNEDCRSIEERPELLDLITLVGRIFSNFRVSTLAEIPSFIPLLQGVRQIGELIFTNILTECEQVGGDVESMTHHEWRQEVTNLVLDCIVTVCGDPWILYGGNKDSRKHVHVSLSAILCPFYENYVRCRSRVAGLEEYFLSSQELDLDEVNEAIEATDFEEEIVSVSVIGRLNLPTAITCLMDMFRQIVPSLQSLWDERSDSTPQIASLLEESRVLTMCICHLVTDDNQGETPAIPDAVVISCQGNSNMARAIAEAVYALMQFAEAQLYRVSADPSNQSLSPVLVTSFLLFLNRWAPAYIYTSDYASLSPVNPIVQEWSSRDKALQAISFCVTLCLHYQCYWPQERQVQEGVCQLLVALARRTREVRCALVSCPSFQSIFNFHCLSAGISHSVTREEFDAVVKPLLESSSSNSSTALIWGYHRMPYHFKSRILTAILVACSETTDLVSVNMLSDAMNAVRDAFTRYSQAILVQRVGPQDVHAKEMAGLCIEMFCGVVQAIEMSDAQRIPLFVTPYLVQLADLMTFYADDLAIGQSLLRLFRDYTINFIVMLNRAQSLVLFDAAAELLKQYSNYHCISRVIRCRSASEADFNEENEYCDIRCALELLINLSTKDFIDACHSEAPVGTNKVTDMIFFGLQQILPLMTQGLLQFPILCEHFFELVGIMVDTYPAKVCNLPYDLFNSLLDSLLFGMCHHNPTVSRCSLHGISSIAKEHLVTGVMREHLAQQPDILDNISRRLLVDVAFQTIVIDRIEMTGMALLPLVAADVNRFAAVVNDLAVTASIVKMENRQRLLAAFQSLIQPDMIAQASLKGYEGRMNRSRFKIAFEEFVNEVHSFLVVR